MNFFGASPTVAFVFNGQQSRTRKLVKVPGGDPVDMLVYKGHESVSGTVEVAAPPGKKVEHQGIKIELIGQIEMLNDRLSSPTKLTPYVKELDGPGTLASNKSFPFEFNGEMPFESYSGTNVRLRYFLRCTVSRSYNNYTKEIDFAVEIAHPEKDEGDGTVAAPSNHLVKSVSEGTGHLPIKMEVGIEDCLHIEFEYDRSKYHLNDVILGRIYFLLVRIKIKHMELAVIRRESAGSSTSNTYTDSENITKYELMDGAPIKGECVPIRLFLEPLALTPTYRSVRNMFSVKYYLNLVLVDEEDRRYFKQQEVTFWRKENGETQISSVNGDGGAAEETQPAVTRSI